ncbi:MAG: kinase [Sphingomonadaceae bacterium]
MNPIATLIADHIERWHRPGQTLVVGVCGTQASGKSTACAQVAAYLGARGLVVGVLGLDDLYLGRNVRAERATSVHPLFATRGPPGTHDAALGIAVIDAVKRGEVVRLPRFDKRADEPLPRSAWPELPAPCNVLLFEGWCVGALPQDEAAIATPVYALEVQEDADGVWRRTVNAHLSGETGALFMRIDRLIYLRPPSFAVVHHWRCQQEHDYLASDPPAGAAAAMSDNQIARFIAHYERITCHIIADMPARADLTIQLDEARHVVSTHIRKPA